LSGVTALQQHKLGVICSKINIVIQKYHKKGLKTPSEVGNRVGKRKRGYRQKPVTP